MSSLTSLPKPTQTNSNHSLSTSSSSASACAACKYQRRRCTPDCTLAPHFPANNPRQFLNVHRLFGVSNIQKILKNVEPHLQKEAMASIIVQSNVRARDPVGGCHRLIVELQRLVDLHVSELRIVLGQIAIYRAQIEATTNMVSSDEVNYAPLATVMDGYENMETIQQQQQQYCNYFFYNSQEEQEFNQNINAQDNTNNILADGIVCDMMSMNMIGNDMVEMNTINPRQNYGEDEEIKPLVDIFDMRNTFEDDEDSKDVTGGSSITALHSSSNSELKEDVSPMEQMQEHDLKGAASLFTLQNCNTSAV